jgi:hypothetical protein
MGNYNVILLGDLYRGFDEICINVMYKLRVEIHFVLNNSFMRTYTNVYVNKKEFYVLEMRFHKTKQQIF